MPAQLTANDTIKKWTDSEGRIHYGDDAPADKSKESETVDIRETYDQKSYEDAVVRHNETQEFADQLENERLKEEEKERKRDANKVIKYPPPSGGTTIVIPQPILYGRRALVRPLPSRPINRPAR